MCKCTQTQMRECVCVIAGCLSVDVNAWIRVGEQVCWMEWSGMSACSCTLVVGEKLWMGPSECAN